MSLAIIKSRALSALTAPAVTVEVHLSQGLPAFHLVGLPETSVKEAKERVRSAILNSHFDFPACRITINLAPADLPKDGGRYDLAIALGILAASEQIERDRINQFEFIGELGLAGNLLPVNGIVQAALASEQSTQLIIAKDNAYEAGMINNHSFYAEHLLEVTAHLNNIKTLALCKTGPQENDTFHGDFSEVQGQHQAKRALTIAAAGRHNVIFSGPPGCGKSMLAERFSSILPSLSHTQQLEVMSIQSLTKNITQHNIIRPFRSPHHSASAVAMVGGGNPPQPGEITLAHLGVLFLDEIPEFPRGVLESLREPLESGKVSISRSGAQVVFPAQFQLIAAMNPCPCGYYGSNQQACRCTPDAIRRYQQRVSGPLLDRIDLHLQLQATPIQEIITPSQCIEQNSKAIQQQVEAAQNIALERQSLPNALLKGDQLLAAAALNKSCSDLLESGAKRLLLSARAIQKIIKVSRTIADLDQSSSINESHIFEALSFRQTHAHQHTLSQPPYQVRNASNQTL